MSCEDYVPEIDNDYDELESGDTIEEHLEKLSKSDIEKIQNNAFTQLIKEGGLRVENIIEIQMLMALIKYCPEKYKDSQQSIAKCLELIINLANQFLYLYDKNMNKTKSKKGE